MEGLLSLEQGVLTVAARVEGLLTYQWLMWILRLRRLVQECEGRQRDEG